MTHTQYYKIIIYSHATHGSTTTLSIIFESVLTTHRRHNASTLEPKLIILTL